jgi:predicted SpoU family rRNA methylase
LQEQQNTYADFIKKKETNKKLTIVVKKDGIFLKNGNSESPFIINGKTIATISGYITEKKAEFKQQTDEMIELLQDIMKNKTVEEIFTENPNTKEAKTKPFIKTMQEIKELIKDYLNKIQRIYTMYGIEYNELNDKIEKFKKDVSKMTVSTAKNMKQKLIDLDKETITTFNQYSVEVYGKKTADFIKKSSSIIAEYESNRRRKEENRERYTRKTRN